MKVAMVCTLYPPYVLGGAEKSTALLAKAIKDRGVEVFVVTTGQYDSVDVVDGITVYRLKNRNIYWRYPQRDKPLAKKMLWHAIDIYNVGYKSALRDLLSRQKPDIVHTGNLCGLSSVVWGVAHALGIPVVHTLRDYYLLCPQQSMMHDTNPCEEQCVVCRGYSVLKKFMSRKVDAVVGISRFILDRHRGFGYFGDAKIACVIPNSVERGEACDAGKSKRAIGYIGRLSPEKGVELLADAFKQLGDNGYELLIAGTGNEKYVSYLKHKYEGGGIRFCGVCSPADFFSRISLLVVPSLWDEPFGRVVIEAYHSHIPVFMADNGGLSELAEEGISRLFATDSPGMLASLLAGYFGGEIVFDGSRFDVVVRKYSESKVADAYIGLYGKLLGKPGVGSM